MDISVEEKATNARQEDPDPAAAKKRLAGFKSHACQELEWRCSPGQSFNYFGTAA
jgi:hypothetical protein